MRNKKNLEKKPSKNKNHYKISTDAWWTCIMVQIAHIIRGGSANDLRSFVHPNLDHWHPPLTTMSKT